MLYIVRSDRKESSWKGPAVQETMWLKGIEGCLIFVKDRAQAVRLTEAAARKIAEDYNAGIRKTDFGSGKLSVEPDSIME